MLERVGKIWEDTFMAITFAEEGVEDMAQFFAQKAFKRRSASLRADEIFSAVTFAEAGEFDTARLILKSKKRLLFLIEDPKDKEIFSYVENLAQRLNRPVEVLVFFSDKGSSEELETFLKKLREKGLLFRTLYVDKSEGVEEVLKEHIQENQGVEFLIIKPSKNVSLAEEEKLVKNLWDKFGFPFILVKERWLT